MIMRFDELKKVVEKEISKAKRLEDPREAKRILIECQNLLKSTTLSRDEKNKLFGMLQDEFEAVNRKIAEEREQFENEAALNYFHLKRLVEEALMKVRNIVDFEDVWSFLLDVQSQFKGIRLRPEQRESLYASLQEAFDIAKASRRLETEPESSKNNYTFEQFFERFAAFDTALNNPDDIAVMKQQLSALRTDLRNSVIAKAQKDELFDWVNRLSARLNQYIEEQQIVRQLASQQLRDEIVQQLEMLELPVMESDDFVNIREQLKLLQEKSRSEAILRDDRLFLQERINQLFQILNSRQFAEKETFLKEAEENCKRLSQLLQKALKQARESDKFTETREFLKSIQSEFKGIKLLKEDRVLLYDQLQQAFQILNARIDEYFKTKKKNWVIRMEFRISELFTSAEILKESLQKDIDELSLLETQLDVLRSAGRDAASIKALQVRIASVQNTIERKQAEIRQIEDEMHDLKKRLDE